MTIIRKKIKSFFRIKTDFKVSFIICGTQKGGTTALDYYLRKHAEICMANKKEVHFFDDDSLFQNNKNNYLRYHKNFDPKSKHKVIGEATPIYMYWNDSIKRIYNYNPEIKLIMILRNPITRAFSHWNMEFERLKEQNDFFEAIQKEYSSIQKKIHIQNRVSSYLERGLYSQQIKKILEYFSRDQLLIIRSKSLKNNPQETLNNISKFLQISSFRDIKQKKVHSRRYYRKMTKEEYSFLKNYYKKELYNLENLLDWDLREWKNN